MEESVEQKESVGDTGLPIGDDEDSGGVDEKEETVDELSLSNKCVVCDGGDWGEKEDGKGESGGM